VSGTSSLLVVLAYKLLALAGYLGCCGLLWTQTRRLHSVIAFAWNPLVLFEVLGKAHNDVLLAFAALLALRGLNGSSLVATTVGALVKLSLLPILPAFVVDFARHRRWRVLVLGLVGALAILTAAYAPFWQGPETLLP